VEFDARHDLLFAEVVFLKSSGPSSPSNSSLAPSSGLIVSQHLEVVLKDIDQFIRLQGFLDLGGYIVDEFVQPVDLLLFVLLLIFVLLLQEIVRFILCALVDLSVEVGLGLVVYHLPACLEAEFQDLPLSGVDVVLDDLLELYMVV
jgi:hypothetical protein